MDFRIDSHMTDVELVVVNAPPASDGWLCLPSSPADLSAGLVSSTWSGRYRCDPGLRGRPLGDLPLSQIGKAKREEIKENKKDWCCAEKCSCTMITVLITSVENNLKLKKRVSLTS